MTTTTTTAKTDKTLLGTLEKIVYHQRNFLIGRFEITSGKTVNAKGPMISPQIGLQYELTGKSVSDPKWGQTFVFNDYKTIYPTNITAIQQYLIENCKWIGPHIARKITDQFGEQTLTICKDNPDLVSAKIKGITPGRAEEISQMLRGNEDSENTQIELKRITTGVGISRTAINQILSAWDNKTIDQINKNPYDLTQFSGIGFLKADRVAGNIGFAKESPFRIIAGVTHTLKTAANEHGHTYLPLPTVLLDTAQLLSLEENQIEAIIFEMIASGELKKGEYECTVSLKTLYQKEMEIAERIKTLLSGTIIIPDSNKNDAVSLAPDQKIALTEAQLNQVFILTGAPGTGKTFTVKHIIASLKGFSLALAAPTGKAAARLKELTGSEAMTIHKLLGARGHNDDFSFTYNQNNPLPYQAVILDEASMIDVNLFHNLIIALRPNTRLILVGDIHQLPPVGPGNVLRDLLAAGIPQIELDTIKRQDAGLIIENCHHVKNGKDLTVDNAADKDFFVVPCDEPEEICSCIVALLNTDRLAKRFGIDIIREVQVLSPLREKTILSCTKLNKTLQETLNSRNKPDTDAQYWPGDKVIQTRNDYDLGIINGDIGYISTREMNPKYYVVNFENPDRVVMIEKAKNDLQLAYAITVHKYQGSEVPIAIIPVHKCCGPRILQRNWLYTAISRAKKCCILIGDRAEIRKTIKRNQQLRRFTLLQRFLSHDQAQEQ